MGFYSYGGGLTVASLRKLIFYYYHHPCHIFSGFIFEHWIFQGLRVPRCHALLKRKKENSPHVGNFLTTSVQRQKPEPPSWLIHGSYTRKLQFFARLENAAAICLLHIFGFPQERNNVRSAERSAEGTMEHTLFYCTNKQIHNYESKFSSWAWK